MVHLGPGEMEDVLDCRWGTEEGEGCSWEVGEEGEDRAD